MLLDVEVALLPAKVEVTLADMVEEVLVDDQAREMLLPLSSTLTGAPASFCFRISAMMTAVRVPARGMKATMKRIKKRHHTRLLTSGGRTWDRVRAISVSENVRGATGRLLGSASSEPLAVLSVELEDTSPKRGGVGRACVSGTNAVRACKHARPFQLASIHGAGDEWPHTIPAP